MTALLPPIAEIIVAYAVVMLVCALCVGVAWALEGNES